MTGPERRVAVWTWRTHAAWRLFGDEAQAAAWAADEMASGYGWSLRGVQFADGLCMPVQSWTAFREATAGWAEPGPAGTPDRVAGCPFTGSVVELPPDAPGWLGTPLDVAERLREDANVTRGKGGTDA